jgi:hypothetical protein
LLTYLLVPGLALLPTWLSHPSRAHRTPDEAELPSRWRYSYIISVLGLMVFAGARVNVGTDYNLYRSTFEVLDPQYAGYFLRNSPQEPGFTLGVLLLRTLSDDPRILFLVSSVITVGLSAIAMRRMSVNFAASLTLFVLLGFYLAPFNILRQGLAVALNFFAYSYLGKNNTRWVLLNVLAQLLHATTVFAAVLQLVLRRVTPSWGLFVKLLGVTLVFALSLAAVGSSLSFLDFLNVRYTGYLQGQQSGIGTYLYLLSRVLLVALLLHYRPKNGSIDAYITLSMVAVCLLLLGTRAEAIGRLELYFGVYLVIALPRAAREIPRGGRLLVSAAVLVGSVAFYLAYLSAFGDLVPYHFDWSLLGLPEGR